jgi:hypothetical protein
MSMWDSESQGLSPQTAGVLMGVLALLGLGFFGLIHLLNQKSGDAMYDFERPEQRTSAGVQMTPGLWKRKGSEAEEPAQPQAAPAAPPPQQPALPPVVIKRQTEESPAKPPSTEPAR